MDGVVLLDLPDHDSTEVSHHLEVDRIVKLADLLVWVLDPQKYADAAVHDRYLAPLASHAERDGRRAQPHRHRARRPAPVDARRRPAAARPGRPARGAGDRDSAPATATGIAELRAEIARRVADKKSTRQRIEADLRAVAARLNEECGTGKPRSLAAGRVQAMEEALADSAGVPTVVTAIERSTRLRAGRATGWPRRLVALTAASPTRCAGCTSTSARPSTGS